LSRNLKDAKEGDLATWGKKFQAVGIPIVDSKGGNPLAKTFHLRNFLVAFIHVGVEPANSTV
jgi:hypothetical protein